MARVFVHPRCWQGPALCALQAHIEERGYDPEKVCLGPELSKGRRELVKHLSTSPDGTMLLQRFDGDTFEYQEPPLEAA